jgi:hypothetical protein
MPKAVNKKRSEKDLNIAFYERYDENFLFNKVLAISLFCNNDESINKKLKNLISHFNLGEETKYDWSLSLRAEIYFTVFMQFEALFALLIAKFQNEPHQLYLTNYKPNEIKEKIQNFLDDDILSLTNGQINDNYDFIAQSLYGNLLSPTEEANSKAYWKQNLENINYILKQVAKRYMDDLKEYNGYKHGLRITRAKDVEFEIPGVPIFNFSETIGYIDVEKDEQGNSVTVEILKKINPEQSFYELTLMRRILRTIKIFRLAEFKDEIPSKDKIDSFLFLDLDKRKLIEREKFIAKFDV